jgi:hypothetical protein
LTYIQPIDISTRFMKLSHFSLSERFIFTIFCLILKIIFKQNVKKIYHLAHNDSLLDPFYSPFFPNDSNNFYTYSIQPNGPNHYS